VETDRFRDDDAVEFLRLSASEGWICDEWESRFLCRTFPQGCLVKRVQGFPVAYVTSIRHETSGWIGNLLVHPDLRRRGLGAELMAQAITALEETGVATIWLTASSSGKPLYERLGFREIDIIRRWSGAGMAVNPDSSAGLSPSDLVLMDASGWGDRRESLITSLAAKGTVLTGGGAFFVVRPVGGISQIGPWAGVSAAALVNLFDQAVAPSQGRVNLCLDSPAGNVAVGRYLERQGFKAIGSTVLMYRGELPVYLPVHVGALGSLGSMG
jgi:GNAT superfamily N-acetyltransferase